MRSRINKVIRDSGQTHTSLAIALKVKPAVVSRWTQVYDLPDLEQLDIIAEKLCLSRSEVIEAFKITMREYKRYPLAIEQQPEIWGDDD